MEKKEEKNRTRLTVSGDQIIYPGNYATLVADLLTVKILLNSVISTDGAKCMTLDTKKNLLMHSIGTLGISPTEIRELPRRCH